MLMYIVYSIGGIDNVDRRIEFIKELIQNLEHNNDNIINT